MKWNIILKINEFSFSIEVENVEGNKKIRVQEFFKKNFEYGSSRGWGIGINDDCLAFSGKHKNFSYLEFILELNKILF